MGIRNKDYHNNQIQNKYNMQVIQSFVPARESDFHFLDFSRTLARFAAEEILNYVILLPLILLTTDYNGHSF